MSEAPPDGNGAALRTLGDVLYAKPTHPPFESEWAALARAITQGDRQALHALYERAGRLVFVLAMRITHSREIAEEVTVEVFVDIWRRAWAYQPAEGTVLAWIMNQARSRARERVRPAGEGSAAKRSVAPPGSSDGLSPKASLQVRLARRLAERDGAEPEDPPPVQWIDPPWDQVAPGIWCKLLSRDAERDRVSMLVRLDPGTAYPAHTHAGLEELHLLDGELWIEDRKLQPGDYNRSEAHTADERVWSEKGCSCVLITSTRDILR